MIVVTGASGQVGRLVIEHLLARGVPADSVTAAVRSPEKAADLADRGIRVVHADYDDPETLERAYAGADRILLISTRAVGRRAAQIRTAAEAAARVGTPLLAYTSMFSRDDAPLAIAAEHREAEQAIRESALPFVFLRNGWYAENSIGDVAATLERGAILSSMGDGRVAHATREDLAEAAAAVLAGEGHENKVYELTGDTAWSLADLAAELSRQSGTEVTYQPVSDDRFREIMIGSKIPEALAEMMVDTNMRVREGGLAHVTGDLRTLLGRPTTGLADAVAGALKTSPAG